MKYCNICINYLENHTVVNLINCNNIFSDRIKKNIEYYNEIINKIIIKKEYIKCNYQCDKCKKIIINKQNYNLHIKNNICEKSKKKIECKTCNKIFTDKRSLIYHINNNVCKKINNKIIDNQIIDNEVNNKIINNEVNNEIIDNEVNNEIIDNEINNKIIDNIQLNKFKKKSIPLPLKKLVWNKYIGEEIGKAKCLCCKLTDITQLSFSCGHIIPESKGGKLILDNLKPICQSCNSSMGTNNMHDYIQYFGF